MEPPPDDPLRMPGLIPSPRLNRLQGRGVVKGGKSAQSANRHLYPLVYQDAGTEPLPSVDDPVPHGCDGSGAVGHGEG